MERKFQLTLLAMYGKIESGFMGMKTMETNMCIRLSVNILCSISILLMLCSCSSSDDSTAVTQVNDSGVFPIVDERLELSMYITPSDHVIDIHTNEAIVWLEDYTNIDLNLTVGPHENSTGKVELMLASGKSLPDVFFTNDGITTEQLNIYGQKGVLIPLNDYIEAYAPNLSKAIEYNPMILDQITMADGNIYSFAKYNEEQHVLYSQKMWINKTWMDELGLSMPTNVEELRDILISFRDNDCNGNGLTDDEIPFAGMNNKWRTDLYGFIMQPFVSVSEAQDLWMVMNEDRKVVASVKEPGFRDGIEYLKNLYEDELLDNNVFVTDSDGIKALTGSAEGNRVGMIQSGGLATVVDLSEAGARDEYVAIEPLKSVNDGIRRTPLFKPDASNVFSITSSCENIEAAVRLGDLLMIDPFEASGDNMETGLNIWYGPNGWRVPENGTLGLNGEPAWYEWNFDFAVPTNINYANLSSLFSTVRKKGLLATGDGSFNHEKLLWDSTKELYEPHGVDVTIPLIIVESEISKQYNQTKSNLRNHMKDSFAAFVSGKRPLEEWETFIGELEGMGLNWYVGETQKAYDKMYK